eukprot:3700140-Alexandrium_andersonii.AAC.1
MSFRADPSESSPDCRSSTYGFLGRLILRRVRGVALLGLPKQVVVRADTTPVAPHGLHHHQALGLQRLVANEDASDRQLVCPRSADVRL